MSVATTERSITNNYRSQSDWPDAVRLDFIVGHRDEFTGILGIGII